MMRTVWWRTTLVLGLALVAGSGCATLRPAAGLTDGGREHLAIQLVPVKPGGTALRTKNPVGLQFLPGADGDVLVVCERDGRLQWHHLEEGRSGTLLEIEDVGSQYIEKGLVGFAFSPGFVEDRILVTYHLRPSKTDGKSVITEWTVEGDGLEAMRAASPRVLLEVEQPQEGHNGGQVAFGPDGYLYVAFGDGGFQKDPHNNSQNRENFLGAFLRIDPTNPSGDRPYGIPEDNPFLGGGHLPEVFAYGLRNPWRWSFAPDGRLVVADVGQDRLEEINIVEAGKNYGWCIMEGTLVHKPCPSTEEERAATAPPLYQYGRSDGGAIIGGYVYRGSEIPQLSGRFVFADHTNGRLWAVSLPAPEGGGGGEVLALGQSGWSVVTFGEDRAGELYLATLGGRIFRLAPRG